MIFYKIAQCLFGPILIAHSGNGLCSVLLGNNLKQELTRLFPNEELIEKNNSAYLSYVLDQINKNENLHLLKVDFNYGSRFQKLVWLYLRLLNIGETVTYSQLASLCKKPKAVRAVANACAKNPLAIVIPCHRVVPKAGGIGNYKWGITIKQQLLDMEKR